MGKNKEIEIYDEYEGLDISWDSCNNRSSGYDEDDDWEIGYLNSEDLRYKLEDFEDKLDEDTYHLIDSYRHREDYEWVNPMLKNIEGTEDLEEIAKVIREEIKFENEVIDENEEMRNYAMGYEMLKASEKRAEMVKKITESLKGW